MPKIKRYKGLLVMLAVIFCLSGCSFSRESEKTTIILLHGWGTMEEDNQVMRDIYNGFEKENPDVSLQLISMPASENVLAKVKEMISVGNMPNLIYVGGTGMNSLYSFMIEQGYLMDLMPYVENDEEFQSMISKETMDRWKTEEGKLYTVTDVHNVIGYWYNTLIFKNAGITKVPETWDEFFEACAKIQEWAAASKYYTVPFHLYEDTAAYCMQAVLSAPVDTATDDWKEEFDNGLELLNQLKNYSEIEEQFTYRDDIRSFNMGHCAICMTDLWTERMFNPNHHAEYALFPSDSGEGVGFVSSCPGYFVGNTDGEEEKEASIRFLKYMLSDEVQERIWNETGRVPSNPGINIRQLQETNERRYAGYDKIMQADVVKEVPQNSWDEKILQIFKENLYPFLTEETKKETFY